MAKKSKTKAERVHTYPKEAIIDAIYRANGIASVAATIIGCHPCVIWRWIKADADVAQAMEYSSDIMSDMAENALYRRILDTEEKFDNVKLEAIKFYLKAKAKKRGYGDAPEQSTKAVIDVFLDEITQRKPASNEKPMIQADVKEIEDYFSDEETESQNSE